jgi:hypothetical protein
MTSGWFSHRFFPAIRGKIMLAFTALAVMKIAGMALPTSPDRGGSIRETGGGDRSLLDAKR